MYQRYIANPDGTFRKTIIDDAPSDWHPPEAEPQMQSPAPQSPPPCAPPIGRSFSLRDLLPQSIDLGDLLLLLILLLLLVDSEEDSLSMLLILAACFLF